jgi:hypothetical protein
MSLECSRESIGSTKKAFARGGVQPRRPRVPAPPRRAAGHSRAQIVVIEEGALPGAFPMPPMDLDQTTVVAQTSGETRLELAQRAIHRIATVQRSGIDVAQVAVLLGRDFDEQAMAARRLLGCGVLASAAHRQCELVFVGRSEDRDLRRRLWELVELLVTEPGSAKVPIRLRFIEQELSSTS